MEDPIDIERRNRRRNRRKNREDPTEIETKTEENEGKKNVEDISEDQLAILKEKRRQRRKEKREESETKEKRKKEKRQKLLKSGVDNQGYESNEENNQGKSEKFTSQPEDYEKERRRRKRGGREGKHRRVTEIGGREGRDSRGEEIVLDTYLTSSLQGLEDDLYSVSGEGDVSTLSPSPLIPNFPQSQLVPKLYTEKQGRFSSSTKKKLAAVSVISAPSPSPPSQSPLDLAIAYQKVFRCLSIYCHGFLAGLGAWQAITVFLLQKENLEFVDLYSPLSQPLQFIFYILTVICTVSVCDRYDVSDMSLRQLKRILTFQSGGIAVLIYLATLILTLSTGNLDDKLSLYSHNKTLFTSLEKEDLAAELYTWKALNLSRCVLVVLGWGLLCVRPTTDLLHKHLQKMKSFNRIKDVLIQPVKMA